MACGCKGKKKKTAIQQTVDYAPNGNGTVRLGLKNSFRLPMKFPKAIDGQDILVVSNKRQAVPQPQAAVGTKPALVVTGRNAYIDVAHKEELVQRWPQAFNAA